MPKARTFEALLREQERLTSQIAIARKREAGGIIKRMKEAIRIYGITAADLDFGGIATKQPAVKRTRKLVKVPRKPALVRRKTTARKTPPSQKGVKRDPKYTDGKGNFWSGGGSMPVWMREDMKATGKKKEEYLILVA